MLDKLREACGLTEDEKLSLTSFEDYTKATFPNIDFAADKIAVIYAQGNIEFQQGPESIGPELATTIRKAREDKNIKATEGSGRKKNQKNDEIIWQTQRTIGEC